MCMLQRFLVVMLLWRLHGTVVFTLALVGAGRRVAHGARLAHLPDQDMIRGVRALGARKPSPGLGQCQPAGRAAGSRPNAAGVAAAAEPTQKLILAFSIISFAVISFSI